MDALRLADRIQIQDCLFRYARGVDRKDWNLVRSAYHADAHDDHGEYKGGVEGFIESLARRHSTIEQSLHLIGNVVIEFDAEDSALVEAYFTTHQRDAPLPDHTSVEVEAIGRYIDRMVRRGGDWRIARRTVVLEVLRRHPAREGGGLPDGWVRARRDGHDPLEISRRALGLPDRIALSSRGID